MNSVEKKEIKRTMGTWINRFRWNWYAHLTFKYIVKDTIKAKKYFRWWVSQIQQKTGKDVSYFMAVERFVDGINTHIHALLYVEDDATLFGDMEVMIKPFWQLWFDKFGRARIEKYQIDKGANFYICKYITKELGDWEVSDRLVPIYDPVKK